MTNTRAYNACVLKLTPIKEREWKNMREVKGAKGGRSKSDGQKGKTVLSYLRLTLTFVFSAIKLGLMPSASYPQLV